MNTPDRLLQAKYDRRDELLRSVWSIMSDISRHAPGCDMSDEDANIWFHVTNHSAIQSRLDAAMKR